MGLKLIFLAPIHTTLRLVQSTTSNLKVIKHEIDPMNFLFHFHSLAIVIISQCIAMQKLSACS